jgi:hypothetical protein
MDAEMNKDIGFQEERFVIYAVVGGVETNIQHINSFDMADEMARMLFDDKHCKYVQVKQHFTYQALDGKQRGDWLLQLEYGDVRELFKARENRKLLESNSVFLIKDPELVSE